MRGEVRWWAIASAVMIVASIALPVGEDWSGADWYWVPVFRFVLFGVPALAALATARHASRDIQSWFVIGVVAVCSFLFFLLVWGNVFIMLFVLSASLGMVLIEF